MFPNVKKAHTQQNNKYLCVTNVAALSQGSGMLKMLHAHAVIGNGVTGCVNYRLLVLRFVLSMCVFFIFSCQTKIPWCH